MAKRVTYTETVPPDEARWRGATFFTATADDTATAEKKLEKLYKKYLKYKPHTREEKDA